MPYLKRSVFPPMALIGALALPSLALAQQAPASADADLVTQRFDALVDGLVADKKTPVALAKLNALGSLRLHVPSKHVVSKLEAAKAAIKDPLVYAALARFQARAQRELGPQPERVERDDALERELGCLTRFEVLGPWDNPSMEAFETALGPELGEVGPYPGKQTEIAWRPLGGEQSMSELCVLNLSASVHPHDSAVAYLATQIKSPKRQRGRLMIGAAGAYRVWLNGKLIGQRREDAGLGLDNDAWSVELGAGDNALVIKSASEQDSGMELMVRLVDEKLKPLSLPHQGAWKGAALQQPSELKTPPTPAKEGVLAQIKAVTQAAADADALWAAWLWRSVERKNASTPWRDVATKLEEAVNSGQLKLTGDDYETLASLYEEHWKRLELLELGRARHPEDPWASYNLLQEYESSLSDELRLKRRGMLEALLEKTPSFTPALLALADWYEDRSLEEEALKLLRTRANEQMASSPRYMMMLMRLLRQAGSVKALEALELKARQEVYVSGGFAWSQISDLIKRGQSAQALELVQQQRRQQPWSTQWLLKEVELLRTLDQSAQALKIMDQSIKQRPGDVYLLEKRADVLLAMDRPEEAAQTLELALRYKPQDQDLREHLSQLRPDANRFHEPWMVEDPYKLAQDNPAGPFRTTTIVDQKIMQVASNGLAQQVTQSIERVNSPEGIDAARTQRIYYQNGDERVDILRVRVHKPDGSITEDYDLWDSDNSRKASTTYNDSSTITVRANNVEVGDLIELRYRLSQIANQNFRGDYFGDISYVQGSTPIAFSRYALLYPKDWKMYFKTPNLKSKRIDGRLPDGQAAPEGFNVTSFELYDVPDVKTDANQPGHTSVYDYILVSNKQTWDEVGTWWWNLVKEQLIVDEPIAQTVKSLIKNAKTDEQKVQAIHNYVVQNTRYLHVGLGIHGWKPYRTTTCFRNRYGDCKDKASLLKVMLEEAGIKANLVLVRTRTLGLVESTPASMHIFNHAITYVPSMDLFLDGTAEFNGTRELTPMDQGAQALIVEDGGKTRFVKLPVDKAAQNTLEQTLSVDLTGPEPITTVTMVAHGSHAVYYRSALEDPERRDETLEKQLAATFPGAKLIKATYSDLKALEQPVTITYSFKGGQLVRKSAEREYIYLYGAPRELIDDYAAQQKRNQALVLRVPFTQKTKLTFKLPKTKTFEQTPEETNLKSKFGHLNLQATRQSDSLIVEVDYSLSQQEIPASEYPAFRQFITELDTALNATVGLKKE